MALIPNEPAQIQRRIDVGKTLGLALWGLSTLILAISVTFLSIGAGHRRAVDKCQFEVVTATAHGLAALAHNDTKGVTAAGQELDDLVGTANHPKNPCK